MHGLLVGADELAHLIETLFAHAHLRHQFHQFAHGIAHFVKAHGAHHTPRHPLLVTQIIGAVEAGHLPQLIQFFLAELFAAQELFHHLA